MKRAFRIASLIALGALASCASSKPAARSAPSYDADGTPDAAAPAEAAPAAAPADAPKPADVPDFDSLQVLKGERLQESMFQHYGTNPTVDTSEDPVSTFSVDVDTASYSMARAMIEHGALPDPAAIRVEEMVNSFRYDYAPPRSEGVPFSVVAEAFPSPNRKGYHVLLLGLRGRVVEEKERPPANLVFVVDVSGSMEAGNRLELVKQALGVLVDDLRENDTVAVVVYGDNARIVLPAASGAEKERIKRALALLKPEGSTNVQSGIMLGYEVAERALRPNSANRIILCSDGVANSGITDADGIFRTVSAQAQRGIALSTVGFGMDNYNDVLMERLAVKGQGRYAYVDRLSEARKVFTENLGGALVTIARDVKVQVHLDPNAVQRYRLLGYENRKLSRRDFDDDKVDAGEIGQATRSRRSTK
jgi:Ca-activated chloride channel homolog